MDEPIDPHWREVIDRTMDGIRTPETRVRELRHLLGAVFESEAEAYEWLHSIVPAFRGRSPISLIREGKLEGVIEVLAMIESGAYS